MGEAAEALWYVAPGKAEIRATPLPPMQPGWVEVETLYSGLSRGTERLIAAGQVPASEHERMRAPHQEGAFPFPVKYGYAVVGLVRDGPEGLVGRHVFSLYPHQSRFRVPAQWVMPIPEQVPCARAILAANAETALNAIWDARLRPGSEVAVIGLGLLGCLIAAFLSRRADLTLRVSDLLASRQTVLRDFKVSMMAATELPSTHVTAFHTSASAEGLASALDALAFEGELIELSWYGNRFISVPLGGAFHARRLVIRSSQVGHVAPSRRATTNHSERLAQALACLDDPRLDAFVSADVPFASLPEVLPGLLAADAEGIATRIVYS